MFRLPRWFTIDPTNPRLEALRDREYVLTIQPDESGEWTRFVINLPYWMGQTFGREDNQLVGVVAFRLQGEMRIASISWS